ncbi:glycosyltransferase family A protein [Ornithinimicrobium avium]|uniref:Glycosyltransferase family 2 protein n=1 Tax=Ornithinimicrobium avium TaxID=2283195 RepID=A0A345NP01_9MICO|nr:glycosyltransferase family A protein [Ornithinimicrobium avium]AXH96759.1 glycosyltransferase family 2 protein [Ornithinimicrobium avium]
MPPPPERPDPSVERLSSVFADRRPMHVAGLALRTRSTTAREALARSVPGTDLGDQDLLRMALAGELPPELLHGRPGRVLAALAMTWAGQARGQDELRAAALAYRALFADGARDDLAPAHHQLAAQTLMLTGLPDEVRRLLPLLTRLPAGMQPFLDADLANPWAHRPDAHTSPAAGPPDEEARRAWEELLSAPFVAHGLAPLQVRPHGDDLPFDRLVVPDVVAGSVDGPLVTVVVPCFRPDAGLLTAVASLAAQSHGALEVLLVDDASGTDYETWFEQALELDDRVRLLRRPTNGGSYLARNDALREARGSLITFQDADDWSHPERVAAQVALLAERPDAPASRALAVRVHDDLTHQWLGYRPVRINASSLMVRADAVRRAGPYLPVRKGADSEYAERLATELGELVSTRTPLGLSRLRSGSLSRSDFALGWTAPERLAFRGTYRAWHRAGRRRPLPAPLPYVRGTHQHRSADRLDTAYLADLSADPVVEPGRACGVWRLPSGWSSVRTGLWHLERPEDVGAERAEMHDRWFDRVVSGPTWQALSRTEPVHLDRLVVLEPSVLLLQEEQECAITTDRVQVHLLPEEDVLTGAVAAVVRRWFGRDPEWVRTR